jgi:hypothetical protein
MFFNFRLRPMGEIDPWGPIPSPDARTPDWPRRPNLSWFGLTDGWYWLDAGGTELFRHSQALMEMAAREHAGEPWLERMNGLPYVDYQVSRLWEDVLDMLPDVLEPVPQPLAGALTDGLWAVWEREAEAALLQALPKDEAWDTLEAAAGWWWHRELDSLYLLSGPRIWIWTDTANAHIQWDNRDQLIEGLPAWEALLGQHTMPVEAYIAEVRSFDARFIGRMRDRVAMAQVEWVRPDVALDLHLADEQRMRERSLSKRFEPGAQREPIDWDDVLRAIARIEALPAFASGAASRLL